MIDSTQAYNHSINPLLAMLERVFDLTEHERLSLEQVPLRQHVFAAEQTIAREGDRPTRSFMLLDGIAATAKVISTGKRQITNLHIPGDMPDLLSLHLEVLDSDVRAITQCRVAFMEHWALRHLCEENPRIAAALWKNSLIDAAIYREWVTNIGQRQAPQRLGHVFCEMMLRMKAIGLNSGMSCPFAVSQAVLGEVTGMSTVHVNRSLMELRGEQLVSFEKGVLTIHDWDRLAEFAGFDETYLHLPYKPAAAAARSRQAQSHAAH